MVAHEFQAQIVNDFRTKWLEAVALDENMTVAEAEECYCDSGNDLSILANRISGKIVTIKCVSYYTGSADHFEIQDNNFVIFESLFTKIKTV